MKWGPENLGPVPTFCERRNATMQFFDCHCHTERSDCAEDVSLEMYVEIAQSSDAVFAITDHSAHLFYPPDKKWAFWGDEAEEVFEREHDAGVARCIEYVECLRAVQTGGMLVGVELDVLPDGRMVFAPELLGELDVVIGAVHGIRALSHDLPLAAVIDEYKSRTVRLCELGVQALAHPFREWAQKERAVPRSLIEWLVETAEEAGVALELNCHHEVPEYDLPMIRLCVEAGAPIAIGTDAHRAGEFGDFRYHKKMLRQAGVSEADWPSVVLGPPAAGP